MFMLDWSEAIPSLTSHELIIDHADGYSLSEQGRLLAENLRKEHPREHYLQDEYYSRAERSEAYARYCEQAFGVNPCQSGKVSISQLERMMEVLELHENSQVLHLGCGNGVIAEYISDRTGAFVTGINASRVAIQQAQARSVHKQDQLEFVQADIYRINLPPNKYDTMIVIDTQYFSSFCDRLLDLAQGIILPGGQMGVYYTHWLTESAQLDPGIPGGNRFVRALEERNLRYESWDFTGEEIELWKRKLRVAEELREDFERESNQFLYEQCYQEARYFQHFVESHRLNRKLYRVYL